MAQHHKLTPAAASARTSTKRSWLSSLLGHGFRALQVRNYRLYWWGQLVSLIGTWMQTTAQSWLVYRLTRDPQALGIVTTLQFLPIMLFSLFGGVIADKFVKRRLLIWTQTGALILAMAFGTLVATGLIQLWHIYIIAFGTGLINAFDNPARQSFAPELVDREYLSNAVALNSMLFNAARIVGPAVAGYSITLFGEAPALFFNAISFCAGIAVLLVMNTDELHPPKIHQQGNMLSEVGRGLVYTRRTPLVLLVMLVMAAIGTFGYNFSITIPLIAGFVLDTDAAGFGNLLAMLGLGSLIAAVVGAYAPKPMPRRLLMGAGGFSIVFVAVSQSHNYALTSVLLILLGFCGITFAVSANTLLQLNVADDMRGRVMGLYMLLFAGSTPIGALLIGLLSGRIGVEATLATCALLCGIGVIGSTLYYHRIVRHQLPSA